MNKQSNTYIVTYATVLVVVVAAVLSFAAIELQPRQEANAKIEKMGAILGAIGKGATDTTADKNRYIEQAFETYIPEAFFVDSLGTATEATPEEVLGALNNLPAVFAARTAMPVFVAASPAGKAAAAGKQYVVPVTGKGLWGPVWGYVALNEDCNTIDGAVFDHKSETPGLGAEIATPAFQGQFVDKQIFDPAGDFVSISLLKGKGASAGNSHAVDAISGGTLTSNGVQKMLRVCLGDYVPFFEKVRAHDAAAESLAPATVVADSSAVETAAAADSLARAAAVADTAAQLVTTTETTEGGAK